MTMRSIAAAAAVAAAVALGCSSQEDEPRLAPAPSRDAGHVHEGHDHDHGVAVPEPYAGARNPLAGSEAAASAGEPIYAEKCARCHGDGGGGDGPIAAKLLPPPSAFDDAGHMAAMGDDYLFWRVSEGGDGAPWNSKMPAWKERLSEEERWQVVAYLRTLSR